MPAVVTPVNQLKSFSKEELLRTVKGQEEAYQENYATLSPMEMIERFASIAQERMSLTGTTNESNSKDTNTFNTCDALRFLASKEASQTPANPPFLTNLRPYVPITAEMTHTVNLSCITTPFDGKNCSGTVKRAREEQYSNHCESLEEEMIPSTERHTNMLPSSINLSYIIQLDNTVSAANTVREIQSLVQQLEQCTYANCYFSLYRRFSDNLYREVKSIHSQMIAASSNISHNQQQNNVEKLQDHPSIMIQKRFLLDQLYKEAIEHVRILLIDARSMQAKETPTESEITSSFFNNKVSDQSNCSVSTVLNSESDGASSNNEQKDSGYTPNENSDISQECTKKKIAEYMTNWLRGNWINPYPDEAGLSEMAKACGTSKTVVNNWLINSRTRKWRPAIAKAYELGRPTVLLKEDSIHIFDGKPVRELKPTGMENFPPLKAASKTICGKIRKGNKNIR